MNQSELFSLANKIMGTYPGITRSSAFRRAKYFLTNKSTKYASKIEYPIYLVWSQEIKEHVDVCAAYLNHCQAEAAMKWFVDLQKLGVDERYNIVNGRYGNHQSMTFCGVLMAFGSFHMDKFIIKSSYRIVSRMHIYVLTGYSLKDDKLDGVDSIHVFLDLEAARVMMQRQVRMANKDCYRMTQENYLRVCMSQGGYKGKTKYFEIKELTLQ